MGISMKEYSPPNGETRKTGASRSLKVGALLGALGFVFLVQNFGGELSSVGWAKTQVGVLKSSEIDTKGWRWKDVIPSENLEWHRCHNDVYDCARLDVPLDWLNESDLRKATLAIIRLNATDRTDYKGPVFINPGGPGGSGIWHVKQLGQYYQAVVGKNHDIISFDPRGIGETLPSISCWNSSTTQKLWSLAEPPVLDAYPGALYEAYAYYSAFSQQCRPQVEGIGSFLTTASVARDMLAISDKLGEEKVKFWGFSYGTYIAATFAALFPDRVGRMVSDGNADAVEFTTGVGTAFVRDTDAVMDGFYFHCHRAGPELCAMYDDSPAKIRARIDVILQKIQIHPIVVPSGSASEQPTIVTFSKLRKLIASSLYRPVITFPPLDKALAALEKGDGAPFARLTSSGQELDFCDAGLEDPSATLPEAQGSHDGGLAVLCTDAAPLEGGVEAFAKYLTVLEDISKVGGAAMAEMALSCAMWPVKAKWRFTGPFEGNTSHPILFVANTADNVTPLQSAQHNSRGFPGSVVLISDSYGHTSLSTPSRCVSRRIRAYFQTGELPPPNTTCPADMLPFDEWGLSALASMDVEEIELEVAMRKLMITSIPGLNLEVGF